MRDVSDRDAFDRKGVEGLSRVEIGRKAKKTHFSETNQPPLGIYTPANGVAPAGDSASCFLTMRE